MQKSIFLSIGICLLAGCSRNFDFGLDNHYAVRGGGNRPDWQINLQQINYNTYTFSLQYSGEPNHVEGRAMLANAQKITQQYVGHLPDGEILTITVKKNQCKNDVREQRGPDVVTLEFAETQLLGCGVSSYEMR